MEIESIIKRKQGTTVTLGKNAYHFQPKDPSDPDSPHVCDVDDPNDIQHLLNIPEGFCVLGAKPKAAPKPESTPVVADGQPEIVTDMVGDDEPIEELQVEEEAGPPPAHLLTLLGLSIAKIKKQLPSLTKDDLRTLRDLEQQNQNRVGVIKAVNAKL